MHFNERRNLQAQIRRDRLRRVALRLFQQKDVEQVTIAEICREARVSVGHFYTCYRDKAEILVERYAVFDRYIDETFSLEDHGSPLETLRALLHQQILSVLEMGPCLYAQILRLQLHTKGKQVLDAHRSYNCYVERLVVKALAEKEMSSAYSSQETTAYLLRALRGVLFDWAMRGGTYPLEAAVEDELERFLRSVQPVEEA